MSILKSNQMSIENMMHSYRNINTLLTPIIFECINNIFMIYIHDV